MALPAIAYAISQDSEISGLETGGRIFRAALFVLFMVCHGELARRRPAARHLTAFYLMVSVGGAIGGLFIGFAAPYLLQCPVRSADRLVADRLAAAVSALARTYRRQRAAMTPSSTRHPVPASRIVVACAGAALGYCARFDRQAARRSAFVTGAVFVLAHGVHSGNRSRGPPPNEPADCSPSPSPRAWHSALPASWRATRGIIVRTFPRAGAQFLWRAGCLRQDDGGSMGPVRVLRHGTIDHGEQFLWPQNRRFPTTYYARKSGIGLTIQTLQMQGPLNVGVIGLGAGTLATYARPIDHYHIYDINPLVLKIANTPVHVSCGTAWRRTKWCMGDARLSLEQEPVQKFDVLAVDAFSGDAIPVHLLTREAYRLYWRHLKPDGVLAVHVSNGI